MPPPMPAIIIIIERNLTILVQFFQFSLVVVFTNTIPLILRSKVDMAAF